MVSSLSVSIYVAVVSYVRTQSLVPSPQMVAGGEECVSCSSEITRLYVIIYRPCYSRREWDTCDFHYEGTVVNEIIHMLTLHLQCSFICTSHMYAAGSELLKTFAIRVTAKVIILCQYYSIDCCGFNTVAYWV
jgi:hypothetical protein